MSRIDFRRLDFRLLDPLDRPQPTPYLSEGQQRAVERFVRSLESGEIRTREVERCLCGGRKLELVARRDRFALPFSSLLCQSCGLILTSPVICEESIGRYYAEHYYPMHFPLEYGENDALFSKGQGEKIYRQLSGFLPARDELRVLDVGGGTGSVAREFEAAARRDGICVQSTILEYNAAIEEKLEDDGSLELIIGGPEALEARDLEPFDVVILSHVLEHFVDFEGQLASLRRSLHEQSLVYVEVPGLHRIAWAGEYGCDFLRYLTGAHIHQFNLTSLAFAMAGEGYALQWGSEVVEGVFKLGALEVDVSGNAEVVRAQIAELERNLPLHQSIDAMRRQLDQQQWELAELERKVEKLRSFWPIRFYLSLKKLFVS